MVSTVTFVLVCTVLLDTLHDRGYNSVTPVLFCGQYFPVWQALYYKVLIERTGARIEMLFI